MAVEPGLRAVLPYTVTAADTAEALGSGDVPVLGTPRVVALAEAATVAALRDAGALAAGQTSVGVHVELSHLAAIGVSRELRVHAELEAVEDRKLRFAVQVVAGRVSVAKGTVLRVIVDRERFLYGVQS